MSDGLSNIGRAKFSVRSARHIGIIVCIVLIIASAIVAAVLISKAAPIEDLPAKKITAILPENDARIGLNANLDSVNVRVVYSDGSSEIKTLTDLSVTGLDTTKPGELENVVLNFGGFVQIVSYTVMPIEKVIKYLALEGGSIEGDAEQHVPSGGSATSVRANPDEGYRFVEWSDGVKQAQRTDLMVSQDKQLSASFAKLKYLVIFYYPNGTTGREKYIEHGDPVIDIPSEENDKEMQLYGYKFVSWNVDNSEISRVTRELHIYPQYEKYSADFSLEISTSADGLALASTSGLREYYTLEETASLTIIPNPERTFVGFEILTAGNIWVSLAAADDSGPKTSAYAIGSSNNLITFISSKNGVRDEYLLTFVPTSQTTSIQVRARLVYDTSEISFTSMSLVVRSPINLALNQTIGSFFSVGSSSDELFVAVLPPSADGYEFRGWYIKDGAVNDSGEPVLITNSTTFERPTELIAYHVKKVYTITFSKGNIQGTVFAERSIKLYWQEVLGGAGENAFPDAIPQLTNYTFVGWYRLNGEVETDNFVDKTTRVDGDMQLYPKFLVNTKKLLIEADGSGEITIAKNDGTPVSVYGNYSLEVNQKYTIKFLAAEGYIVYSSAITLDDGVPNTTIQNVSEYTYVIGANNTTIIHDYRIKITFTRRLHEAMISNGDGQNNGIVEYDDILEGNENGNYTHISSDDSAFTIKIAHGSGKILWITAKEGYYISAITIGGVPVSNLPMTSQYSAVLQEVYGNMSVEITYSPITFSSIIIPSTNGSVERSNHGSATHTYGDNPEFRIEAEAGYYISKVVLDGVVVNPYLTTASSSYIISHIVVLGKEYQPVEGVNHDERTEKYNIQVIGRSVDFTIEAEFTPIYYKIQTTTEGLGEARAAQDRVGFGGSVLINASTLSNYYVASYQVNDESQMLFGDSAQSTSQSIKLENITEDKLVKIIFSGKVYSISFIGANNMATVEFVSAATSKPETHNLNYTALVEAGTTAEFTIKPIPGTVIQSVTVDGISETIGYNVSSHRLVFTNLRDHHEVEVFNEAQNFKVAYYISNIVENNGNEDDNTFAYSPDALTLIDTASYLNGYAIVIRPGLGRDISNVSTIIVKNSDTGEDITNTLTIQISLNGDDKKITITGIRSNIELFVPLADTTTKVPQANPIVTLKYDESMATITYDGTEFSVIDNKTITASINTEIQFNIMPIGDNILKYVTINGVHKADVLEGATSFTIIGFNMTTIIDFVFAEKQYTLTMDKEGAGLIFADIVRFASRQGIYLSIIPDAGYRVSEFSIANIVTDWVAIGRNDIIDQVNSGNYVVHLENNDTLSDMTIRVKFAPLTYQLVITAPSSDGAADGTYGALVDAGNIIFGSPIPVSYGATFTLKLGAAENCFIERVDLIYNYLNPLTTFTTSIYPDELMSPEVENYRYTGGTLNFTITGNMRVEIVFTPNRYTAAVVQTSNGSVEIRSSSTNTIYEKNGLITLYSNESLFIRMTADKGYHIAKLYINGTEIAPVLWKLDTIDDNNNRIVEYIYELDDSSNNYAIYAEFQINKYSIQYEIINSSINYAANDLNVSQFGTLRIDGLLPLLLDGNGKLGIYTEIDHGADITFRFSPIISKGYYVSSFMIHWTDPDDPNTSQEKHETLLNEAQTGFFTRQGLNANLRIEVEYKRSVYDFSHAFAPDQGSSSFTSNGSMTITFTNPYTGQPIDVGSQIEYGTSYNVSVKPGVGYYLSSFLVNNQEMLSSVYSLMYFGDVRTNVVLNAIYKINTYEVVFLSNSAGGYVEVFTTDENVQAIDGNPALIWSNNPEYNLKLEEEIITNSGVIYVYSNYITVTHNTELKIVSIPNASQGYQVGEVAVNGVPKSINTTPGSEYMFVQRVEETSSTQKMEVNTAFVLRRLKVNLVAQDLVLACDNFNAMSPSEVDYGGNSSSPANARLRTGYSVGAIAILRGNETFSYSSSQLELINTTRLIELRIDNIYDEITVTITFKRDAYDITFSGDYNKEYDIGHGISQNSLSIAGVLIANRIASFSSNISETHPLYSAVAPAEIEIFSNNTVQGITEYNDSIIVYIMPVDGYHVASILIKMVNSIQTENINDFEYSTLGGYYSFFIPAVTGELTIDVQYEINSYAVIFNMPQNGSLTDGYITTIKHHELLNLKYTANAGYHLTALRVNGFTVYTNYEIKHNDNGTVSYIYSTSGYYISDSALKEIRVDALFELNIFNVSIYVNGVDASSVNPDSTLIPVLNNTTGKLTYGSLATIIQNKAEGYSITNIVLANALLNPDWQTSDGQFASSYGLNAFEFLVSRFSSELDFHNPAVNTLYILYATELDKHTPLITTYLYETGKEYDDVPTYEDSLGATKKIFDLEVSYNTSPSGGKYSYFTRATYLLTLNEDVNYYFAGFQELKNGSWVYCTDGSDGVQLTQGGYMLQYQTTSSRSFRAVVYRIYTIEVRVYPDYKYTGGSYTVTSSTTTYRLYTTITTVARFTNENRPNLAGNSLSYSPVDEDFDLKNGVGIYRVYSGATLTVQVVDTLGNVANNDTKGYKYYYVERTEDDKPISQTLTNKLTVSSGGDTVVGDKLIHIYAENQVKLSVGVLTEGSSTGSEGGTVNYFNEFDARIYLDNTTSLSVTPNSKIRIEIIPNNNFRFDNISFKNALAIPGANDTKRFDETWTTVADHTMNTGYENRIFNVAITYVGTRITKVTVTIHAIENMIFNIKFWKQINVVAEARLFSNTESVSTSIDASLKAKITNALEVTPGIYNYGDEVKITIDYNDLLVANEWNAQYRFIGFYINGINTYERLGQGFPSEADFVKTIKLDSSIPIVGGTTTEYTVSIVAMFVPVLNFYIENSADMSVEEYQEKFDFGNVSVETYEYSSARPQYFTTTSIIKSYAISDSSYTKVLRAMSRINGLSGQDMSSATSEYNVFNTNMLTLTWVDASQVLSTGLLYSDMFLFMSWQVYDVKQGAWVDLTYEDSTNPNNRPTSTVYSLPLSVLLAYSYLGASDQDMIKYIQGVDISGSGTIQDIPVIKIRPYYRRKEVVTIIPEVCYDNPTIPNPERSSEVSAYIVGINQPTAQFIYGDVITLNHGLAKNSQYAFKGWYLQGDTSPIPDEGMTLEQFENNKEIGYAIIANTNLLAVRMNDTRVFTPVYVKQWVITIKTMNLSASLGSSYVQNSTLSLSEIDNEGKTNDSSRLIQITMEAGTEVKFGFVTPTDSYYDAKYDKYIASYLTVDGIVSPISVFSSESAASNSVACIIDQNKNIPTSTAGDQSKLLYDDGNGPYFKVIADSAKVIEVQFKIFGEIEIRNVYAKSTLIIPESLAEALAVSSGYVDTYIVDDGERDELKDQVGVIGIKNIPIEPSKPYNEYLDTDEGAVSGFGNSISTPNGTTIEIRFKTLNQTFLNMSGDALNGITYAKKQIFAFYSGGGQLGASGHEEPFADAFSTNAGDGTENKPFLIANARHMEFVNSLYIASADQPQFYSLAGIYFKLKNSINLAGALINGIASDGRGFDANFDGDGYSLNNWNRSDSYSDNVGIFAQLAPGSIIKNLFVGGTVSLIEGKSNVGYLAGLANGATLTNIGTATAANSQKNVAGINNVGGLIGAAYDTTIIGFDGNGASSEKIAGDYGILMSFFVSGYYNIGGVVGLIGPGSTMANIEMRNPSIYIETEYGNSNSGRGGGGVVGSVITSDIGDSKVGLENITVYAPEVGPQGSDSVYVGGIVGLNEGRQLKNLKVKGVVNINSKFSTNGATDFTGFAVQEQTIIGNNSGVPGFGGGGIVGYNKSYFINGALRFTASIDGAEYDGDSAITHTLSGSVMGGVIGINGRGSELRNAKTASNKFETTRSTRVGGIFGVIVGYNAGGIYSAEAVTTKWQPNKDNTGTATQASYDTTSGQNITYLVKSTDSVYVYVNADTSVLTNVNQYKSGPDPTTIFLGGIAGYNSANGKIEDSKFKGKLMTNRLYSREVVSYTYVGGIAGVVESAYQSIKNCTVTDSALFTYSMIWVDADSNMTSETGLGGITGYTSDFGSFYDNSATNSELGIMCFGNGSEYNDWPLPALISVPSGNGSVKNSGNAKVTAYHLTSNNNTESGIGYETHRTDKGIPGDIRNGSYSLVFVVYYRYTGFYRNINIDKQNVTG
ncbi:MAG: InlB B-repeat-containing protein [Christensenellaceae bacterium]|jgi:hypothetical protein|nr:InlB B-repeat-containing protein [Christensenellaceae bacterium]